VSLVPTVRRGNADRDAPRRLRTPGPAHQGSRDGTRPGFASAGPGRPNRPLGGLPQGPAGVPQTALALRVRVRSPWSGGLV